MFTVTAGFKTKADDPQEIPIREFFFDSVDKTTKVLDLGGFAQRYFEGSQIAAVGLSVLVLNDAKEWNGIISTKTNIGKEGKVKLGFDAERIDRFIGKLDRAEFISDKRPQVRLLFTSRITELDKTVGDTDTAITETAQNPADLAWTLLATYGLLDNTTSTANVDIDYASWLAWKTTCFDFGFSLAGSFSGQTVRELIRLIATLTDSIVFPETDGKIYFSKFQPLEVSVYAFTDTNADFQRAKLEIDPSRILNKSTVFYAYSVGAGTWGGSVVFEDTTSQTNYGLTARLDQSTVIWHDSVGSANAYSERLTLRYANPVERLTINTKSGTQAIILQIGDIVSVTWNDVDYSTKLVRIHGLSGSLTPGGYEVVTEDVAGLNSDFFILDSAVNGVLDTNKLY